MSTLEAFQDSTAWDFRFNLPIVPQHNNPFIYLAYAYKVIRINKEDPSQLDGAFAKFLNSCEIKPGLYYRWPDGTGGSFSFDECMGVAYISQTHAAKIWKHLSWNLGKYDNGSDPKQKYRFFRFNLFRHPFFIAFLRLRAGKKAGLLTKFIVWSFLKYDSLTYKSGDEGGRLRIWLMLEEFHRACPKTVIKWKTNMYNKGVYLTDCFSVYFPSEPVWKDNTSFAFQI